MSEKSDERVLKNYRLPRALVDSYEAQAKEAGVTATAWVQAALERSVEPEGRSRPVPVRPAGRMSREDGIAFGIRRAEFFQGLPKSAFRSVSPGSQKRG